MKLVNSFTAPAADPINATNNCLFVGFVDDEGQLKPCNSSSLSSAEMFSTKPCISQSLLVAAPKDNSKPSNSRKRSQTAVEVAPMHVHDILYNHGVLGQKVIIFIRENKFIDIKNQVHMLKILIDYTLANGNNLYPSSSLKTSMAKGIIVDFPELADDDNGFTSWYNPLTCRGMIQTKYQTMREAVLSPEEKKNRPRSKKSDTPKKNRCQTSQTAHEQASSDYDSPELELPTDLAKELSETRHLCTTANNKARISTILHKTFVVRRKWVQTAHPSCTEILNQYYHLASFEGKMISQEFQQQNPLANNFVEVIKRWVPHILNYASKTKPVILKDLSAQFSEDNLDKDNIVAVLILPKLLPTVANAKTMKPGELDHLKRYRALLDAPISSSLVQIFPFGTNVTLQSSLEAPREERERKTPIYPFLMWTTADKKTGPMYLKIDQKSIFLGSPNTTSDGFLKAVDLTIKSYFCFNLEYPLFENFI